MGSSFNFSLCQILSAIQMSFYKQFVKKHSLSHQPVVLGLNGGFYGFRSSYILGFLMLFYDEAGISFHFISFQVLFQVFSDG